MESYRVTCLGQIFIYEDAVRFLQTYWCSIDVFQTFSIDKGSFLDGWFSCMDDSPMKTFAEIYKLRNLVKEPTCFKNPQNPACIDLILTNKLLSFKNTYVIETGLSQIDSSCDENAFS